MVNKRACLCRTLINRTGQPYIAQEGDCPIHSGRIIRVKALTVITWLAVLAMFAFIGYSLIPPIAPEYPEPTVRYTETSYESLDYQNKENLIRRMKAEQFIEALSKGNIR